MKKVILPFIILTLLHVKIYPQGNFKDGYIVTLDNDTIYGQVDFRSDLKNYKSCRFRKDKVITKYAPKEIKGYGNPEIKFFASSIRDDSFVELLVKGEMSLYKFKNTYFIKKNNEDIYVLEKKPDYLVSETIKSIDTDNHWRGLLIFLFSDCQLNMQDRINNLKFYDKEIIAIVIEYNNYKEQDILICKKSLPWTKCVAGISASMMITNLNIKHPEEKWIVNPGIQLNNMYEYLNKTYNQIYPEAGLVFTIYYPRVNERLAFRSGLYYSKSDFKGHVDLETTQTIESHDTYMDYSIISIPFSVLYSIPLGKFSFSAQPGIQCNYYLKNETRVMSEILYKYGPDLYKDNIAFEMQKVIAGPSCGIGINRLFKYFSLETVFRYIYFPGLNKEQNLKVRNYSSVISLNISLN